MSPRFTEEFKREVAHIVHTSGLSRQRIADDFGVSVVSVNRWARRYPPQGSVQATEQDLLAENKRLRKELHIAQQERDILKKATAFFASQK